MELVAPAGNLEKLHYAWEYGADSAYIGLKNFSLRVKADNFFTDEYKTIRALKERYAEQGKSKKLLCALNSSFHNEDIKAFLAEADYFKLYPIDAFIVQDIGMVPVLRKHFPDTPLHLSTQANCINYEAVRIYRDLGFKRGMLCARRDVYCVFGTMSYQRIPYRPQRKCRSLHSFLPVGLFACG